LSSAIVIAAIINTCLISAGRSAEQDPDAVRLRTTIDEKTATLSLRPRSAELLSEKAMRVRNLIKQAQYASAQKAITDVLASSHLENWRFYPFSDFMSALSGVDDPAFEVKLNEWVEQDKTDPIPWIVRAQYSYDMGWFKRGRNFAQDTAADRLAVFTNYMAKGLVDAEAAIRLDDHNPYGYYLKLRFLRGFGVSEELKHVFEEAIIKYPGYYPMYDLMLQTLQPRWGGTPAAMYDFVNVRAGQLAEHSPLKLLYLSLYRYLLSSGWVVCNAQRPDKDKMAQCVALYMGENVPPDLESQIQESLQLYNHSDKAQFALAIKEILFEMLRTPGGEVYAGAVLQLAANAMHSNTQLKEDKSGHNNYIIDEAVAESWYQKRFYDNALTKYREALEDVEFAEFGSEEQKDAATSFIYDHLAGVSTALHQYVDLIVFEKAAIALGGKTGNEHLICYGYYQLKQDEEGVDACTSVLREASNLPALYWRGRAYQRLGQMDAALKDLRVVADSGHNFRTSAAISMSVIYDELKDFKSSLDVLDKYTFLYDAKTQNKNDIAASYNNRCYAYMELGDLKQALGDCTVSLQYGSLPDAYRKQQEIVKRLKARETAL
jgi:tetratricopeptide (TPR) repeat protein